MSVNFNKLDAALKKMGGALRKFPIKKIKSTDPIEIKIKKGVSISRGEFDKIKPVAGFLNVEGHHAFLYIDQPFASQEDLEEIPSENGPDSTLLKSVKLYKKCTKIKDQTDIF